MNATESPLPYHDESQYLNFSCGIWEEDYRKTPTTELMVSSSGGIHLNVVHQGVDQLKAGNDLEKMVSGSRATFHGLDHDVDFSNIDPGFEPFRERDALDMINSGPGDYDLFGVDVIRASEEIALLSTTHSLEMFLECDGFQCGRTPEGSLVNASNEFLFADFQPEAVPEYDQQIGRKNNYGYRDDDENDPLMKMIKTSEITVSDEEVEPYQPIMDHDYARLSRLDQIQMTPIKIEIKEECSSDVDVWNDPGLPSPPIAESYPPSPLPCTRTRRTRAKTQVSINRAAKAVLKGTKRQRSTSAMTTRKSRKVGNSLETSPSGSDSEDPKSPMPPPRRAPARRGAASKKGTSAKPTKSELQRNTHNQNEKMRRSQMTKMMEAVRELVPQEFYKDSRNKAKASKQKVLIAATEYVHQLKKRVVAQGQVDCKSYEYTYHNMTEELAATKAKLDKVVKKFLDKYYRVKGYHYSPKQRR